MKKGEIEPGIYRMGYELQVLDCRSCYSGVTTLVDNSKLVDNN